MAKAFFIIWLFVFILHCITYNPYIQIHTIMENENTHHFWNIIFITLRKFDTEFQPQSQIAVFLINSDLIWVQYFFRGIADGICR